MKRLAILMTFMMVFATFGVAAAQEDPEPTLYKEDIKNKKLIHKYKASHLQMEKHRIGMEALIAYVDSTGGDSSVLVALMDEILAMDSELEALAAAGDADGFEAKLGEIKDKVAEFRNAAREAVGDNIEEAKKAIEDSIEEKEEELDDIEEEINEARGEAELEIADEAAEEAEKKIAKFREGGANVSAIQAKLEEIKQTRETLREKMEAAVASCNDTGLGVCETPEALEYQALKEEIKGDYKELSDIARSSGWAHKVANAIETAKKTLEKTHERLDKAEAAGRDVTVQRAMLDEVDFFIAEAQAKYDAGDYKGASEDIDSARDAFRTSQKDAREQVKEERTSARADNKDAREERGRPGDDEETESAEDETETDEDESDDEETSDDDNEIEGDSDDEEDEDDEGGPGEMKPTDTGNGKGVNR